MKFKVMSLRVEKFMDYNERDGENEEAERYILNCERIDKYSTQKYEVRLWTHEGDCYSGWCAASYGYGEIVKVNQFTGTTHKPIKQITFELDIVDSDKCNLDDINNDIFEIDYNGGDNYYASGRASVSMELFEDINRNKENRPVWLFYGNSCLGKTYLAQMIGNSNSYKTIYETDIDANLPDEITEDIIVLGNKYKFDIDDIDRRIKQPHELIMVEFKSR